MTYATQSDLTALVGETELIQLTDRADPPTGIVDVAVLDDKLAAADALIDSLLSRRYAVPLTPTPPIVRDAACDIARYRLYVNEPPDEVRRRFDDALRWLHDVAAGRADIPDATPAGASPAGSPRVVAPARVFTTETLSDF